MGVLSDDEFEFEHHNSDIEADTPPASPTMQAMHAQALAENYSTGLPELDTRTARNFAALCCEEFGLTDADKDDVIRTSQMNMHLGLIRLYTRVVGLTRSMHKAAVESFLSSPEFKDHITCRIQATFLDYDLPSYVRGSTSRLIQHMQENPASWRIPTIIQANFVHTKAYWKAVGAIASNFRGDMRRKIKKSIVDKIDIGALAKKLCVKGYQPTKDHWRRFSLLRVYMIDWEKIPVRRGAGRPPSFWAFIDSKLDKLRDVCTKATVADTKKAMKEKLNANLRIDEQMFPGPSSGKTQLPARVLLPEWQKDHARAVLRMSTYVVNGSHDDDVDDEEALNNAGGDAHDDSAAPNQGLDSEERHDGEDGDEADDESDVRRRLPAGHNDPDGTGADRDAEQSIINTAGGQLQQPAPALQPGAQDEPRPRPIPRILVPETQQGPPHTQPAVQPGSSQSSTQSFVPETQRATQGPQSGTPGLTNGGTAPPTTPAGWAGGSLVDRHPRSSNRTPSPITNPNTPPPDSRRLRSRR